MLIDELLTYLFDGQSHLLAPSMAEWLASSRQFTAFVTTFRDKIRKKVRATQELESLLDLRFELETAYFLLQERPLSLLYEPQPGGQGRCPDFAVTFTTSLTFMVEVTRLRSVHKGTSASTQTQARATPPLDTVLTFPFAGERLTDTMCSKLRQLLPQRSNVLIIGVEDLSLTQSDLHAAMLRVQQRAEQNDVSLVQRHRFRDRADFFHHYQRLSEVLVRGVQRQASEPLIVWVNPQAKHPLPSKVRTVLYRSHTT